MKIFYLKRSISIIAMVLLMGSCTNFSELTNDPNKPTSVPPSMLLSEVLTVVNNISNEGPWSEAQRDNQFWVISFDYYGDQDYNWGAVDYKYSTLSNIVAMEKEAKGLDSQDKYEALAKFFKAYFYDNMSKRVGDIPMTEAMQANSETAITQPKYDSQKDVYIAILDLLDQANDQITLAKQQVGTSSISGDFFFNGDLDKWQKVINAFHLRILLDLSKKNTEMDIATKFNNIISNPSKYPLMSGLEDNLQRSFSDEPGNNYALNPGNFGFNRNRNIMGATYLNILKNNYDPRLYEVADPAPFYFNGEDPLNMNAYVGANSGDDQGAMQVASDEGKFSYPNENRYYSGYTGEPYIQIGYSEQEFTIAEAINRGWVNGDAQLHYENGIIASMNFYSVPDYKISNYFENENIYYAGNNTIGLEQILTQKYVAFFNNSGRESYFNQRRTGIPEFNVGPANNNGNKIPLRWKYPQGEFDNNNANITSALNNQYGGSDDINGVMWLIQ